jgi:hypothetical protein
MPNLKLKPAERAFDRRRLRLRADVDDSDSVFGATTTLVNPGLTAPIIFTQVRMLNLRGATGR